MLTLLVSLAVSGAPVTIYDFQVKTIDGKDVSLAQYKGKALLVVNTASECGYTPQYKGLEQLYQAYKAKGFEVLAFPSNDFGAQEPGSDAQIKKFCELKYKTTFPLFSKLVVKGKGQHPLYTFLTKSHGEVQWNFSKFLVAPDGKIVAHLESGVEPMSDEFKKQLEAVLPAK